MIMLNCKNTINLPKCFTVVILSAFSPLRMSYKLISKINISEYKHSHNLSKALYIKRIALPCQTISSKFCQTILIKEKKVQQVYQSVSIFVFQMTEHVLNSISRSTAVSNISVAQKKPTPTAYWTGLHRNQEPCEIAYPLRGKFANS